MKRDKELAGIEVAYEAIKGLDRNQWGRALNYLAGRLAEDDRMAHIYLNLENYPPPQWFIEGNHKGEDGTFDCREEAVDNSMGESWEPIKVNGIAVVSQWFAVVFPIGDGDDVRGTEVQWFDTRAQADAFIASALNEGVGLDA